MTVFVVGDLVRGENLQWRKPLACGVLCHVSDHVLRVGSWVEEEKRRAWLRTAACSCHANWRCHMVAGVLEDTVLAQQSRRGMHLCSLRACVWNQDAYNWLVGY